MSLEHSPAREGGRAAFTAPVRQGERAVFTVAEFCDAHRISRAKLYQLWQEGIGPRVMRVGNKVLITVEAAADWRQKLEAEAA